MGASQVPAEVPPEVVPAPTVPPEARELAEVVTDLVQKTSELVLACEEISEEMVRQFPVLKELKDICLDTARSMRRFLRLSRRRSR
jgi:hypothetical protein